MNDYLKSDVYRYYGKNDNKTILKGFFTNHAVRFLYFLRGAKYSKFIIKRYICKFFLSRSRKKYGLEIGSANQIGKGFYLGHAYNITINPNALLGNNINIHKGVTIAQENRGKRMGTPKVGDCVWIGVNSTIVGNITIGNDVLIAANAFVNVDIPDHSIVIGNPCKVISREQATLEYINKKV